MHKAHRRHGARRRGWPFIAAMMAGAEAQSGFGASARFGGSDWGFDFGPRKGGRRRRMFGPGRRLSTASSHSIPCPARSFFTPLSSQARSYRCFRIGFGRPTGNRL